MNAKHILKLTLQNCIIKNTLKSSFKFFLYIKNTVFEWNIGPIFKSKCIHIFVPSLFKFRRFPIKPKTQLIEGRTSPIPVQCQINTPHSFTADIPTAVLASTEYYHGRTTSERPPGCSKLYALMTALPPSKT